MSSNDVNSKVVDDIYVPLNSASIIKDITVDFDTLIFDEIHMSSDSTGDDVNEIVESNIPAVPRKSFESPCVEYSFMVIPIESYPSESLEFLTMIRQMISNAFFY